MYVNEFDSVPLCPSVLVTDTLTVPEACAGVTAVRVVLLVTLTPVAGAPPILTAGPAKKLVPVIVIAVPPAVLPLLGEIDEMVGAAPGVPAVVKLQMGPLAVMLAMVLLTIRQ